MRYYKITDEVGKLVSIGVGAGGEEITKEEFYNLYEYLEAAAEFEEDEEKIKYLDELKVKVEKQLADILGDTINKPTPPNVDKGDVIDFIEANYDLKKVVEPGDKVGYNFEIYYLGETEVYRAYVVDTNAFGSKENPCKFIEGMTMTQNAYYTDGKTLKVWFGAQGAVCDSFDDDNLVAI